MNDCEPIDSRLARLERRCRRLTLGVIALSTVLATACLSSAMRQDPDVLRAKRIEVLGADGEPAILLLGEIGNPDKSFSGAMILMRPSEGDGSSAWMVGRTQDEVDGTWHGYADFHVEAGHDSLDSNSGAGVTVWTNDRQSGVKVLGGPRRADLEAEARRTSLRFYEEDPDAQEDEEDLIRMSLELLDDDPGLRAFDTDGATTFEQP